ncbi:anaphase-promoting complex component apc8 [Stylosanthes scabra]|uniref:Anaphase-promoting complex component apc8 n=1 Tax=Stylosanthes scabra TaxID=79078 RepID=A0ABU6WHK9_9FABA|nr:anaphase-promoting complex component apc8 [Stylosanthes scabra]
MSSKESCRSELRVAIRQLSDRCLYTASKWAAEQLVGIEQDLAKFTPSNTRFQRGSSSIRRKYRTHDITTTPIAGVSYVATPVMEEDELVDGDFYLLAKSYFDCREYKRAAHVLGDQTGRKSVFLRCYALYLAGEKRKEEEMIELEGPLGSDNLARTVLVESVNSYPWNWNAWTELRSLCRTIDILNNLNLNSHWMKDFFLASAYQELRMHNESLSKYEYLLGTFGNSNYIQAQIAKAQYSLREFDQVEALFEELMRSDPYRVEDMDMYSNVLYAKECFSALSFLAHRVFMTDKYRPESYIDPCDYRAWYGLGQAYEMMGMPFYALHYFQKSVFLQPNDSRLWIAMAQCYETEQLRMLDEAIKCYKRAAACNDREAIALYQLAKLHAELGHPEEAASYYKKDLERMEDEEREGPNMVEALLYLARYYKLQERFEEAEVYCTRLLDYSGPERETAKSLLRGMRSSQLSLPSIDVERFPP